MGTEKASWDEIKRLAADFKRVQLGSSAQLLTERNCIEIVTRLCMMGLLEVIYTTDGRTYLTPQELLKEIYEELELHGGRINLVDIQKTLSVDFSHIESKVHEMMNTDTELQLILGQIINATYVRKLAQDIKVLIEERGHLRIADLTKQFDLPSTFITSVVHNHLGTVIPAHLDGEVLYTDAFIQRHKLLLRGLFSALVRPINLNPIVSRSGVPEKLFFRLLEELVSSGRIRGSFGSGKSTFIPHIYSEAQDAWVTNFVAQNGYIEQDSLRRIGMLGGNQLLQKLMPNALHLERCSLGKSLVEQVLSSIEESLNQGSWVDASFLLPVVISSNDYLQLLEPVLKKHPEARILAESVIVSSECYEKCRKLFDPLMAEQAELAIKENPKILVTDKSTGKILTDGGLDDVKVFAKSGKGGGQRGREKKTKVTKNKYFTSERKSAAADNKEEDNNDNENMIPFLPLDKIEEHLKSVLTDEAPDEFRTAFACELEKPLLRSYQDVLQSVFLQTSSTARNRASVNEVQEKLSNMTNNLHLFEKGALALTDAADLQTALLKHIRRQLGGEVTNYLLTHAADSNGLEWDSKKDNITFEMRQKLIGQLPGDISTVFKTLNQSLRVEGESSLEDFFNSLDNVARVLGLMIRRHDKKREKQACQELAAQMASQITCSGDEEISDPAVLLLTICCLLYQGVLGWPVNAPGKCVPQLVNWLKSRLKSEDSTLLTTFQENVVIRMKAMSSHDTELADGISVKLTELTPQLKELASRWKKVTNGSKD